MNDPNSRRLKNEDIDATVQRMRATLTAGGVSPTAPDERDREVISAIAGDRGMSSVQCDALADDLLAVGFLRSREATTETPPEPEWEYGLYEEDPHRERERPHRAYNGAHLVSDNRAHVETQHRKGHPSIKFVKRSKAGPWMPVEAVEASRSPKDNGGRS